MRLVVDGHDTYIYTGSRALEATRPTLLFVHGAAHDHSVWALQSRYFAHHGYNVLAVDLPGHGRSAGTALPSIDAIADWLPRVLDATHTSEAALIGHSMGALAVLACAGRHPTRASRIALLGPAVPMLVSDALLDAARDDEPLAVALITGWSYSAQAKLGRNPAPGSWMTGAATRLLERAAPGLLCNDLNACNRYEGGMAAAVALRCPALVILGGRDVMAPAKGAQALIKALPDKRVQMLPHAGHSLMAEEPGAVLDALRAFVP